jgi:energy-coupling factor transport system permease protein
MSLIHDITLGQYFPADSVIHRLDPRTKIISSLMFMLLLLVLEHGLTLVFVTFVLGIAVRWSRIPFAVVLKNIRPFIWLFLLTLILHLFFTKGRVLWQIPVVNFPIYAEALEMGLTYAFRLIVLILIATLLTLTTSPVELTDALYKMLAPLKRFGIPVYDLIMMMTLAMRFIPTLLQEADRIQKAQMSRGAAFEGNFIRKLKSVIPLLLPLFISAFRRADELALAMDSRCYHGGEGRTNFVQLQFSGTDYGILIGNSLILIAGIGLKITLLFK